MNSTMWVMLAAFAGLVAGCDKAPEPAISPSAQIPPAMTQQPPQMSPDPKATKDSLPPVQGQTDTREPAQRRAFETKTP